MPATAWKPQVSETELGLLNFYRASELHGGLVLGQIARRVRDGDVVLKLLRHSAEEIEHARLWTEAIIAVGGRVEPVRRTYQTMYAEAIGCQVGLLQVLALTQIFERRVYRHFLDHLRRPGTHPVVAATLRRMIEEEKGHLSWVKVWLEGQAVHRGPVVRELMTRYAAVDRRIYDAVTLELGWRSVA
jgi:rubrerythrin